MLIIENEDKKKILLVDNYMIWFRVYDFDIVG